ncbi:MAG: hypothetical protein INF43_03620 [Alphaproteobacteria bacterium]|nr:hypothetical protein [Alphaproteobacteria bacterium]
MLPLTTLAEADWPALHRLMRRRKFPHTPATLQQAAPHFRAATVLGLKGRGGLQAGFIFGPPEHGIAFFDAVCRTAAAGRWATRPVLQALFRHAFAPPPQGLGLRALWVQPHGRTALQACLAAGFQAVTPLKLRDGSPPVLVITPRLVPITFSFNPQQGAHHHGQPV